MEENPISTTSLDVLRTTKLIELYTTVLNHYGWLMRGKGICEVITYLYRANIITSAEYTVLLKHFHSIPRPLDANQNIHCYYWNVTKVSRRIEFLKEIINNLQDGLNLQTNDK